MCSLRRRPYEVLNSHLNFWIFQCPDLSPLCTAPLGNGVISTDRREPDQYDTITVPIP